MNGWTQIRVNERKKEIEVYLKCKYFYYYYWNIKNKIWNGKTSQFASYLTLIFFFSFSSESLSLHSLSLDSWPFFLLSILLVRFSLRNASLSLGIAFLNLIKEAVWGAVMWNWLLAVRTLLLVSQSYQILYKCFLKKKLKKLKKERKEIEIAFH